MRQVQLRLFVRRVRARSCDGTRDGTLVHAHFKQLSIGQCLSQAKPGLCVVQLELGWTRYSAYLRTAVEELLGRDMLLASDLRSMEKLVVNAALASVDNLYAEWKNMTDEGKAYVDADDEAVRAAMQQRKQRKQQQQQQQQQQDRTKVPANVPEVRAKQVKEREGKRLEEEIVRVAVKQKRG